MKEEKGVTIVLVKWEGYKKATWEPKSGLIGEACEYHQEIPTQEPITCQISHVSFFDKKPVEEAEAMEKVRLNTNHCSLLRNVSN